MLKKFDGHLDLGVRFTKVRTSTPIQTYGLENGIIDLGTKGARANLVEGWSNDEIWEKDTFVWGTGKRSKIRFAMSSLNDLRLVINARGLDFPGVEKRTVNVYCNGKYIDKFEPDPKEWKEFELNLPKNHMTSGTNTLMLVYSNFVVPNRLNPNAPDKRELALPVDYIKFIPVRNNINN